MVALDSWDLRPFVHPPSRPRCQATTGTSRCSGPCPIWCVDILQEGRQEGVELGRQVGCEEGRRREASTLALRQLERLCGSLDAPTSARIEALSLWQLEELALALLDFRSAQDLQTWLEPMEP